MDDHELHMLRRQARRDGTLSNGAVRLLGEVVDLSLLEDGCEAKDRTLARWLGTTQRTLRRWKKELFGEGYLRPGGDDEARLVPRTPAEEPDQPDKNVRTKVSDPDKNVRSGEDEPDKSVRSQPDKNVRSEPDTFLRDNNTSNARGLESGGAPAHGASAGDGSAEGDPSLSASDYGPTLKSHPGVEVHDEFFPAVQLNQMQREQIASTVDDLDLWRQTLEWWAMQDYRSRSIGNQLQKYREDRNEQSRGDRRRQPASQSGGGAKGHRGDGAPPDRGGAW